MKNKFSKKNSSTNQSHQAQSHTFYKEQKNAGHGEFDIKKSVYKPVLKYTKWSMFAFLGVTTLWGCVDLFLYNTESDPSRGLEVYNRSDEDVKPNIYNTQQDIGYWSENTSYDATAEDQEFEVGKDELNRKLDALPIYVENPAFHAEYWTGYVRFPGDEDEYDKWLYKDIAINYESSIDEHNGLTNLEAFNRDVQNDQEYITVNDYATITSIFRTEGAPVSFVNKTFSYARQVTLTDIYFILDVLMYDQTSMSQAINSLTRDDEIAFLAASPQTVYNPVHIIDSELDDDKIAGDIDWDSEMNPYDFEDREELEEQGKITIIEGAEEDGSEDRYRWSSTFHGISKDGTAEGFEFIDSLNLVTDRPTRIRNDDDREDEDIQAEWVEYYSAWSSIYTNMFAFRYNEDVSTNDQKIDVDETPTSLSELWNTELENGFDNTVTIEEYTAEWGFAKSEFNHIEHGSSFFIVPPQKAHPIDLAINHELDGESVNQQEWINSQRGDWQSKDSYSTNDRRKDPKIQNAGWAFVDGSGQMRVLKDANGEETFFYGNELDHNAEMGHHGINGTVLGEDDEHESVAHLIDSSRENEWQAQLETVSLNLYGTDNSSVGFSTQETEDWINFQGLSAQNELGFYSTYRGYVNPKEQEGILIEANQAIRSTGQSSYNQQRIALMSWGHAWSISPFYGTFVYPLSQYATAMSSWLAPIGPGAATILSIFIIVFSLRGLSWLATLKSSDTQHKMQEVQLEVAKIKAKYEPHKDNKQMKQRQQQEIMALYKKREVNPFASFGTMFLTMPFFLAIWTIISAIPAYKVVAVGSVSFAVSPIYGIFNLSGAGIYLLAAFMVGFVQYVSQKLPNHLSQKRKGIKNLDEATKQAMKKSQKTQTIMTVVFVILGVTLPLILGIYWTASAMFTITQSLIQHWGHLRKGKKTVAAK